MVTKTKTLLLIGDEVDFETFMKFRKQRNFFSNSKFDLKHVTYSKFEKGIMPKIQTKSVIVFPFFPFEYWNKHVEPTTYKEIYGNKSFYSKLEAFWIKFEKQINLLFSDNEIEYINNPKYLSLDRDKELTKNKLERFGIPTPKGYKTRSANNIIKLIDEGKKLYIKVRFGAMGKGITYLCKDKWLTNFIFKGGKLKNQNSEYEWTFSDVTNNESFLKELLKQDIVIEEEINPLIIDDNKFDLRIYISFGKVKYIFPRTNSVKSVITNISQGGKGEDQQFLKRIPAKLLQQAKDNALRSAKAMRVNFVSVDIMFDSKTHEPIVIEVNTFPGLPTLKRFDLPTEVYSDIVNADFDREYEDDKTFDYSYVQLNRGLMIEEAFKRNIKVSKIFGENYNILSRKGKKHIMYAQEIDEVGRVSVWVTHNKQICKQFLSSAGVSVPDGKTFDKDELDVALSYYNKKNKSVVCKPVDSDYGNHVFVNIKSISELKKSFQIISKAGHKVLIEEYFPGQEYRIFATEKGFIAVINRVPANVVGDGIHSISNLVLLKNKEKIKSWQNRLLYLGQIKITKIEREILKAQGLTTKSILKKGQLVYLRNNSNVSTGGDSVDVTDIVHSSIKKIASDVFKAIPGLRYAGIDLISKKPLSEPHNSKDYRIIEINNMPGIDIHHFPYSGKPRNAAGAILDLIFP